MTAPGHEAGNLPPQPPVYDPGGVSVVDLAYDAATRILSNSTGGDDVELPEADGVVAGLLSTAQHAALVSAAALDAAINVTGSAYGSILYYDGSVSSYVVLAPGTAGHVLQTNGAGAAPSWVAPSGGGGGSPITRGGKVIDVVQNGSTIEVWQDGVIIDTGAVGTISDHVGAIQAAIDAGAGTYTVGSGGLPGYGGGALVRIGPGLWQMGSAGGVVHKWGVEVQFMSGCVDRDTTSAGFNVDSSSMFGAVIRRAAGFPSGAALWNIGVTASGSRVTTNPHGVGLYNAAFASDVDQLAHAIRCRDTNHVKLWKPTIVGFGHNAGGVGSVGILIESTLAPDNGGLGTEVIEPFLAWNDTHLEATGTGSTDGRCVGGRWLQAKACGINLNAGSGGGGWQIVGGGHFTTGNDAFHIDVGASPCVISGGHYFDTTGTGTGGDNYHIRTDSGGTHISGNHFKCSSSGGPEAPILLSGNGRKASVGPNNFLFGSATKAAVAVSAAGESFALFGLNTDNDGAGYVSPVIVSGTSTPVTDNPASKRWVTLNPENALA